MNTPLLNQALHYAQRGWRVFPCAQNSKNPACAHGFHDASADAGVIRGLWRSVPNGNIGSPVPPGVVVVDVDDLTALRTLPPLPPTRQTRTPRGGAVRIPASEIERIIHDGAVPAREAPHE